MKRAVIYFGFRDPVKHKRGVENAIEVQARTLKGYRKYYVYFDNEPSVKRWAGVASIGIKYGPLRFIALNMLVFILLRRLAKKGYQTVIHSHNYPMSLLLWRRSDAFDVHDGLWYLKRSVGSRFTFFFYLVERMVYGRVRHVRCNSRFTYENSLLAISGRSATIISSATPFEHLEKQALQKPTRLAPLNSCMVLSVRSMEPRARIDLLIDVAERAQQQNIPFSFVVAGKGPLLEQYRSEIRSRHLSNITLLGYVSDLELVRLYAGCDVVLMTCESGEGFGLPVIEGYLFGKPVVASNRCAVPEVIISQDHLVENNSAEILDRLTSFISLRPPADTFRAYYQQHFSSRVFEEKFHDFYEAIFSGLKSGPDARLSAGKIRQTGVPSR